MGLDLWEQPCTSRYVSCGGDRAGEERGLELAVQLVSVVSKEDRVMLVGKKETRHLLRIRERKKKNGRRIKKKEVAQFVEKTVDVEVIERLRLGGTSLKILCQIALGRIPLSYFPTPSIIPSHQIPSASSASH
jgi:hypothetical protein